MLLEVGRDDAEEFVRVGAEKVPTVAAPRPDPVDVKKAHAAVARAAEAPRAPAIARSRIGRMVREKDDGERCTPLPIIR